MRSGFLASIIAATVLIAPITSEACPVRTPKDPGAALRADAVIAGHVRNYRRGGERYKPFSVTVRNVMSGDPERMVTVSWERNTNVDVPDTLNGDYLFVLYKNASSPSAEKIASYTILQDVCGGAYVFLKGSEGANEIRAVFGLLPESIQTQRDIHWWLFFPMALLALGGVAIGLVLLWRRQKRLSI